MKPLILILTAGIFGLFAPVAKACFCIMPQIPEAVERAHFIFVGEVKEIITPVTKDENAPPPGRFHIIKFKVEKSWKGAGFFSEVSILSAHGEGTCAFPPVHKGEKYLVFADPYYFNGIMKKGWSIITSCNRTQHLEDAATDLKMLGPATLPSLDINKRRKR